MSLPLLNREYCALSEFQERWRGKKVPSAVLEITGYPVVVCFVC